MPKPRPPVIEVIDDVMAEVLRRMSGAEKLRMVDAMFLSARQLIESSVRSMHPEWPDDHVQREVARRVSGAAD